MVSLHGAGRQYDWLMNYAGFLDWPSITDMWW